MMSKILWSIIGFLGVNIVHAQDFDWASQFSGTTYGQGLDVVIDSDGNTISTGIFTGTIDLDPGAGVSSFSATSEDIYVTKQDQDGTLLWAIQIGSIGGDNAWDLALDTDDNIYLTGYYQGTVDFDPGAGVNEITAVGSQDIFLLKLNSSGDFVWVKSFGSSNFEEGRRIKIDQANAIYLTGIIADGTVDMDPGAGTAEITGFYDAFLLKLDASGNFVWAKSFTNPTDIVQINDFEIDASGNVYATGRFKSTANFHTGGGTTNLTSAGNNDIFLCQLNSSGDLNWVKQMGGSGSDVGYGLTLDERDGTLQILITGGYAGTVDFDPGAATFELISAGDSDLYAGKFDNSGNLIWAKSAGGDGFDQADNIYVNSEGYIYLNGAFSNTADFDPGAGSENRTTFGNYDGFVLRLTPEGDYSDVYQIGGTGIDWTQACAIDALGNISITGFFSGTADLDPTAGISNFTTLSTNDPFVIHLAVLDASISSHLNVAPEVFIYPNPVMANINIQCNELIKQVEIYAVLGTLIQTDYSPSFSVENLTAGIYFIKVQTESGWHQIQFIKN